tara:strand:+ start:66 stop:437 length:372 start_codon:yes stop_codon:yes gene_type:complete
MPNFALMSEDEKWQRYIDIGDIFDDVRTVLTQKQMRDGHRKWEKLYPIRVWNSPFDRIGIKHEKLPNGKFLIFNPKTKRWIKNTENNRYTVYETIQHRKHKQENDREYFMSLVLIEIRRRRTS